MENQTGLDTGPPLVFHEITFAAVDVCLVNPVPVYRDKMSWISLHWIHLFLLSSVYIFLKPVVPPII